MVSFGCTNNGLQSDTRYPAVQQMAGKDMSLQSGNYLWKIKYSQYCVSPTIQVINTKIGKRHQHMWTNKYVKLHQNMNM